MRVVRRTFVLRVTSLVALFGSGCGTTPSLTEIGAERPRPRKPPAWLAAGTAPIPADITPKTKPKPEPEPAQITPVRDVPRIEEAREPASNPAPELLPVVQPAPPLVEVEPEWKPASHSRVP